MTLSSQEKHLFYSFHTFAHIRQHYFSKYWGDECMGRPPTSNFGGTVPPVPPRFPPLAGCCFTLMKGREGVSLLHMWSEGCVQESWPGEKGCKLGRSTTNLSDLQI